MCGSNDLRDQFIVKIFVVLQGEQFGMRTKEAEYHTLQQQSQELESELNGLRDQKVSAPKIAKQR